MTRRLLYLSGLAICGVVLYHATGWGFTSMFWWTDRYFAVSVPNFDQVGSVSYYGLRLIEQTMVAGVSVFLFVAGVFAAFAAGSTPGRFGWAWVPTRLVNLVIPYGLWSVVIFTVSAVLGDRSSIEMYVRRLLLGGATPGFYFIPLLVQLYLLSPLLMPLAKDRWRPLLFMAALVQLAVHLVRYALLLKVDLGPAASLAALAPAWFFPGNLFWFVLGAVMSYHYKQLMGAIARMRWAWVSGLLLVFVLGILEWEVILRLSGELWIGTTETLVDNVYTLLLLLSFLAFEELRWPGLRLFSDLGGQSYGIYLVHGLALTFTARLTYHVAPQLLGAQLFLQALLVAAGLGVPWLLMAVVRRTPLRPAYPYLFG